MSPRQSILTRLYVVLTLLLLLPAGVAVQLARIYVAEGAALREAGEQQAAATRDIPAVRGAILDREGRALAVTTARFDVAVDPTAPGFSDRAEELYRTLAAHTGESARLYRRRVADRASRQYALLARSVAEPAKEALDDAGIPGVLTEARLARRYTYGRTASHVLGHVDRDGRGIAGVEQIQDAFLQGEPGRRSVQRDRRGLVRAVADAAVVEPQHGEHIVLTLDLVRQTILEEELKKGVIEAGARWGTAIALDPKTGAILALANYPDYDPNRAAAFSEAARRNHALTDQLEPGSTFKLVTAVAALETGTVTERDTIDTGQGYIRLGGRTMRDSHAYGRIPFGEAITHSSNVAMAKVALQMDGADLYRKARDFGFGMETAIDLPGETAGVLRHPDTWSGSTKTSLAIGYAVSATPLQIVTAYSALANGGLLVSPYVVQERRSLQGEVRWSAREARRDSVRRVFQPETAARLMPYFERVVSDEGTAVKAAVEGLRIAGKTGTARVAEGGGYSRRYRASFVGTFPAEAPEVALVVVMDTPQKSIYGGQVSAPVFSATARRWVGTFPSVAERMAPVRPLPRRDTAFVRAVDRLPAAVAAARLRADGFRVALSRRLRADRWAPVGEQWPGPGARAALREEIRLREADRPALASSEADSAAAAPVMPDLAGLSARQAVAWLAALGVEARLVGTGAVAEQVPAAGRPVRGAATLTLQS